MEIGEVMKNMLNSLFLSEKRKRYNNILYISFVVGKIIKNIQMYVIHRRKNIYSILDKGNDKDEKIEQKSKKGILETVKNSYVFQKILKKPYRACIKFKRDLLDNIYLILQHNDYMEVFLFGLNTYRKTDKEFRILSICGVKEYCEQNKLNCFVLEDEIERTVCSAEFWRKSEKVCCNCVSSERYIAEIKNAEIIGESTVLSVSGYLLNDMLCEDSENRIDLRDRSLKKVWDREAIIVQDKERKVIKKAINLVNVATFNYYHALVEVLTKLLVVDQYDEYSDYPILIDEIVLKIPQLKEALEIINYKKHPIISIKKDERCYVKDLVYISGSTWLPLNLYDREMFKKSDFMISEKYLMLLRNHILCNVLEKEKNNGKKAKIFISRKNTKTVRLKNEEKIRKLFQESGFEIVYTEEMTFREQVKCFNSAGWVVSATGAALTNIIFCEPGTKVVCIMPKEFKFETYSTLAHIFKLDSCFLDAKIVEKTRYIAADTYVLDEKYAKSFIENCVEE